MKKLYILLLKCTVIIIGLLTAYLCIFWLPKEASEWSYHAPEFAHLHYPLLFGIEATAIPFFVALFKSYLLLILIEHNESFSLKAVKHMKVIQYCGLLIVIGYILGNIYLAIEKAGQPGIFILGVINIFVALVVAFFAGILKEVLYSGYELREWKSKSSSFYDFGENI